MTPSALFASFPCSVYDLNTVNGAVIWHWQPNCNGGGGSVPVFAGRYLVENGGNDVFDSSNGDLLRNSGNYLARTPAADVADMFVEASGSLEDVNISSGAVKWTFKADGKFDTAPLS